MFAFKLRRGGNLGEAAHSLREYYGQVDTVVVNVGLWSVRACVEFQLQVAFKLRTAKWLQDLYLVAFVQQHTSYCRGMHALRVCFAPCQWEVVAMIQWTPEMFKFRRLCRPEFWVAAPHVSFASQAVVLTYMPAFASAHCCLPCSAAFKLPRLSARKQSTNFKRFRTLLLLQSNVVEKI
jgi:hypothetical protein